MAARYSIVCSGNATYFLLTDSFCNIKKQKNKYLSFTRTNVNIKMLTEDAA
jgi:hypothetical protein